jgi:protein-disulfide isomerase
MNELARPITDEDHAQGSADALITLVEYGDYQCPSCGDAYLRIKQLQKQLGHKMRFVYRNFPLKSVHPYADFAAENQESLGEELIVGLANKMGLDSKNVREDLETHKFAEHVKQDFMGGVRSGVSGTPGIFINGNFYKGDLDKESVLSFVDRIPS